MSGAVIKVEGLSKAYRIGYRQEVHSTLGDAIVSWVKTPIRNWANVTGLGSSKLEDRSNRIHWALRDINFEVKPGQVLGIIGKNGAGKSTLLKILSKITDPTRGQATIYGRVASLLEVGTGFNPELTGRENVYLNGAILGMTKREISRKFDEILAFSGVEKFIDTPVKRYSSGMKVRLAFAVAAHLEPEILIVDEVLAVGDVEFQKKCLGKIEDVSEKEGRTILFVSHDMSAVSRLSEQIMVLENGSISFLGDKNQAIDAYLKKEKTDSRFLFKNDQFTVLALRIRDGEGKAIEMIPARKPFSIDLEVHSVREINDIDLDLVVRTRFGVIVSNLSTILAGQRIGLEEGMNLISCHVPACNLAPETYKVDIHMFYGEHRTPIKVQNAMDLVIINSEEAGIRTKFRSDWFGYVLLDYEMTTKRNEHHPEN